MSYRDYYTKYGKIAETAERKRLCNPDVVAKWLHWGPYLSDRQWGTVREWYGAPGQDTDPWTDFKHDDARSRVYRWGEDGIFGISDIQQLLCFSVALWNGSDPILKERFYGHTNPEGNHGEDVKEYYFYLVNTPTHSYMKALYKYPYNYPYEKLASHWNGKNDQEKKSQREYELMETGAFDQNRYFDVQVEYAKNTPEDILVRITVTNRGDETKTIDVLPTMWYRNTWEWKAANRGNVPSLSAGAGGTDYRTIDASAVLEIPGGPTLLPGRRLYCKKPDALLFTNNETNRKRFGWGENKCAYVKDGINDHVVKSSPTVDPGQSGTKAAARYSVRLGPAESCTIDLRLTDKQSQTPFAANEFDQLLETRRGEADAFYRAVSPYGGATLPAKKDTYEIQVQAFAGMLWSKQFFYLIPAYWLKGDEGGAPGEICPPFRGGKTTETKMRAWQHLYCKDVISMPDKWEYPWFAAWDLAFHTTTLAIIDPEFAKHQLELFVMEWFQHPNGQIPAYEWDFGNINPPVHAWAVWQIYQTKKEIYSIDQGDLTFLDRMFEKLNMNFTWWVNRTDDRSNNIFEGGFLGLDNIRVIERDEHGNTVEQADGTAWMAMFCLNMLRIALELAETHRNDPNGGSYRYQDAARKYLQHFMYICKAMNDTAGGLWDDNAGFFVDRTDHGRVNVYSVVGLVPLFAIEHVRQRVDPVDDSFYSLNGFLRWHILNRPDLLEQGNHINLDQLIAQVKNRASEVNGTIAVVDQDKLKTMLTRHVLCEEGFLSPHGIRGLSKYHLTNTQAQLGRVTAEVKYEWAESITMVRMGGNSNWCGPVWLPMNYLLIQSLRKFHTMLKGQPFVDSPVGKTLDEVADGLSRRLIAIFQRGPNGQRPVFGGCQRFQTDPYWRDNLLFYEYFHGGDNNGMYAGAGLGASHQTGWTGLVANLIQEIGVRERALELGIKEDPDT